jgi:[citrate (pro-3S)-lyase] ligase
MSADIRDLPLSLPSCRGEVAAFLAARGLRLAELDGCAGAYTDDQLMAVGGYRGDVIQCVAARPEAEGQGLVAALITYLRGLLRARGARNIFVFTKPENEGIFRGLAFYPLAWADKALLLESDRRGVARFVENAAAQLPTGEKAALVMNANPFTLGHQYLAETATAGGLPVVIFIVEEDRSAFSFESRLALARAGCKHLPSVTVLPGGPYMISRATFPTYFLKEAGEAAAVHAALDADLFARHIAPSLRITRRYVGEEPLDPLTAQYNAALMGRLPQSGVAVTIIPRRTDGADVISASRVRALIAAGRLEEIRALAPEATYAYICHHREEIAL